MEFGQYFISRPDPSPITARKPKLKIFGPLPNVIKFFTFVIVLKSTIALFLRSRIGLIVQDRQSTLFADINAILKKLGIGGAGYFLCLLPTANKGKERQDPISRQRP
jgi:hypothetical protein